MFIYVSFINLCDNNGSPELYHLIEHCKLHQLIFFVNESLSRDTHSLRLAGIAMDCNPAVAEQIDIGLKNDPESHTIT